MLDGKRYYTGSLTNPELRPRIRAVLDALANLDKHSDSISKRFSQTIFTGSMGPPIQRNVTCVSLPKRGQ
jgi:hypothetical protein